MIGGLLLGLINIALLVAVLIFVGVLVVWGVRLMFRAEIDGDVRKWYLIVVGLVALYHLVALVFGLPSLRIIGSGYSQVPAVASTIGPPRTQVIR